MQLNIGIPTSYKGVVMRSRTEARWAAYFDMVGWKWEYEPADLSGYIPDFFIESNGSRLLVEVKPDQEQLDIAKAKIEDSGWDEEAVILVSGATSLLGAFLETDRSAFAWGDAEAFYCLSCGSTSILCVSGSWKCRLCGHGHGNSHVGKFDSLPLWNAAGNRVQWKAPKVTQ